MGTETAQNPTPTTTPATDASPFHVIPGHETIQAAPKSVYQVGPSGAAHGKAGSMGSAVPEKSFIGENIDKLTEPIENYTPAGREAHPILARLGDVTRGVKELLEGGQTPMGAKSGVLNNPATAFILPENQEMVGEGLAAKGEEGLAQAARGEKGLANTAAKAEELAREYAPKVASHLAETGHNFLTGILEDARAGLEATAPEGSTEAGFAKIPGYRKEGPAPELPKKPKAVTEPAKLQPPVEVNPDAEATKKAEDDLAAARANYVHDMEKNPTTFPKGTPVHEQVVNVDPNKVIAKVNPGGNTFDEPTVQKYQRMIRNGEDIPAARIEYGKTGDVRGYDGRHRVEAARREGAPVKLWTRREVEPGEAPPTTIGHEEPQAHELNGDETPESANGNIPESQQAHELNGDESENDWRNALQKEAAQYDSPEEFEKNVLIHGTSIPHGGSIDYVEPKVGELTSMMYGGQQEESLEPLAFFKRGGDLSKVQHYATGTKIQPKTGIPHILVTEMPSDAEFIGEDSSIYDKAGHLISHNAPIQAEPGDVISRDGARVIAKIPLSDLREEKSIQDILKSSKVRS